MPGRGAQRPLAAARGSLALDPPREGLARVLADVEGAALVVLAAAPSELVGVGNRLEGDVQSPSACGVSRRSRGRAVVGGVRSHGGRTESFALCPHGGRRSRRPPSLARSGPLVGRPRRGRRGGGALMLSKLLVIDDSPTI